MLRRLPRRFFARLTVAAAFVALALPVAPGNGSPLIPLALSPFVGLNAALAARGMTVATALAALASVVVIVRRRWLCRRVCPVGLLVDILRLLRGSRLERHVSAPAVGRWLVWLTLGAAVAGFPLFLWLDPFALFSGALTARGDGATWASAVGLLAVVAISLWHSHLWCGRLCALGAAQDVLFAVRRLRGRAQDRNPLSGTGFTRRTWLAVGSGVAAGVIGLRFGPARGASLRPPGAAPDPDFGGLCARCGSCIRVCPSGIIKPDVRPAAATGFLAPTVRFESGYCLETCHRCAQVCPSGAIARLSLEAKRRAIIGLARLDAEVCWLSEEKECGVCVNRCPYQAISLVFDQEAYVSLPRVAADRCNGCGACELVCPTKPKAIKVTA
ncbi:MAG: 4Fe-4S dicluster domain-containing protein [Verrucomicrobia bacterium]|nr:4Fe-4S dicluster domain-containing protein [Verrucomicrobiota bacterium]